MDTEAAEGAAGAGARQPRRGPAPIASFDHDGSDEVRPDVCISVMSSFAWRQTL